MKYITQAKHYASKPYGHFIIIRRGDPNWNRLFSEDGSIDRQPIPNTSAYRWCEENYSMKEYEYDGEKHQRKTWGTKYGTKYWTWWFDDKEDAMAFKLRWV